MADPDVDRDLETEDERRFTRAATYESDCCLCTKRIRVGESIVLHAFPSSWAHARCEDAGLEEPQIPTVEDHVETARGVLAEIARRTRSGSTADPEQLIAEVHELAVTGRLDIAERKA